ncbi:MAG: protein-disulfide reductase DsbD family protein [Planctomycetota bacterium]|jgi:cytochrome c biogenesis protein CcdA
MLAATKRPVATLAILLAAAAAAAPAVAQPGAIRVDTEWVLDWDKAHPGSTVHAALSVEVHDNFHFQSNKPLDDFLVPTTLSVSAPEGFTVREIVFPKPVMFEAEYSEEPMPVFEHEFVIGIAIEIGPDVEPGVHSITSTLGYQACNDKVCLAPTTRDIKSEVVVVPETEPLTRTKSRHFEGLDFTGTPGAGVEPAPPSPTPQVTATPDIDCDVVGELEGFTILGTTGGYLGADDFIAFIDGAETGNLERNVLEGKGPLVILVLVILGGLALNLTPCVLPLIPINLAIIGAGVKAGSRARGFALGGTYGLAMALAYGVLGLVVTLTAATFGAINSTIWFNVAIAVLFVVLGLAMFDIIYIDFSKFQSKLDMASTAKRGTFALAFGMGAVSALLAGACVAPVVIQVIVYAGDQYTKGSTLALALPFFLGLGMALPWPFAGAGLSCLPKPGNWMVRVKQALGIFILAFAAYYGYLAWEIFDSRRVDPSAVAGAVQEQLEGGWTASICDGLATAGAENKPVLIDMWATWCKNCLAMDKTTFKDETVAGRLDDYVKIKFQAEDLKASPARELLEKFEGIGLPTYAILRPQSDREGIE